jgi:NitT/TauT family transport system ATP-binding protein
MLTEIRTRPAFVSIKDVVLQYGGADGTLALQNATFDVAEGEFISVVGPSGCGKSTLMKALSGLWPVTSGDVVVGGARVTKPLDFVGMAFQNPNLLPWRTVLGNLMLPLEIVERHRRRLKADRAEFEAKARDLLSLVGLADFESRMPWHLSGGMQQRIQLCRALIHEPILLMLDEPFGALDMFTREELWGALQDLWIKRRPTVILVTHDLREAAFLSDRVLVMSSRPGRIVAEFAIDVQRPRRIEQTYETVLTEIVHGLRSQIKQARQITPDRPPPFETLSA